MQTWKTDDFTAIMRNHAYFSKLQGYIASAIANTEGDNNFAVILRNSDLKLSSRFFSQSVCEIVQFLSVV